LRFGTEKFCLFYFVVVKNFHEKRSFAMMPPANKLAR
jgi:hypothetical protein